MRAIVCIFLSLWTLVIYTIKLMKFRPIIKFKKFELHNYDIDMHWSIFFAPGTIAKYCDQRVCRSVCLQAYLKNRMLKVLFK